MTATASTTAEALNFYRTPAKMTDPGGRASALDGLPAEVGELAGVAQGLLLHEHIAPAYGVQLSDARSRITDFVNGKAPAFGRDHDGPFGRGAPPAAAAPGPGI